jgi:hypothetical protein
MALSALEARRPRPDSRGAAVLRRTEGTCISSERRQRSRRDIFHPHFTDVWSVLLKRPQPTSFRNASVDVSLTTGEAVHLTAA